MHGTVSGRKPSLDFSHDSVSLSIWVGCRDEKEERKDRQHKREKMVKRKRGRPRKPKLKALVDPLPPRETFTPLSSAFRDMFLKRPPKDRPIPFDKLLKASAPQHAARLAYLMQARLSPYRYVTSIDVGEISLSVVKYNLVTKTVVAYGCHNFRNDLDYVYGGHYSPDRLPVNKDNDITKDNHMLNFVTDPKTGVVNLTLAKPLTDRQASTSKTKRMEENKVLYRVMDWVENHRRELFDPKDTITVVELQRDRRMSVIMAILLAKTHPHSFVLSSSITKTYFGYGREGSHSQNKREADILFARFEPRLVRTLSNERERRIKEHRFEINHISDAYLQALYFAQMYDHFREVRHNVASLSDSVTTDDTDDEDDDDGDLLENVL